VMELILLIRTGTVPVLKLYKYCAANTMLHNGIDGDQDKGGGNGRVLEIFVRPARA